MLGDTPEYLLDYYRGERCASQHRPSAAPHGIATDLSRRELPCPVGRAVAAEARVLQSIARATRPRRRLPQRAPAIAGSPARHAAGPTHSPPCTHRDVQAPAAPFTVSPILAVSLLHAPHVNCNSRPLSGYIESIASPLQFVTGFHDRIRHPRQ